MGFGPQLVDFDGDDRQDVLSGNWVKLIILFRQQPDGVWAAGEPIKSRDGKPIELDYGVAAFATDWDGDGDLDLLAGTTAGGVFLVRNEGTRSVWAFVQPERVTANGEEISVPHGEAGPVMADWDGDGKPDLLIGTGLGSVLLYRNVGSRTEPQFDKAETLVPEPEPGGARGIRAKICVTDWNMDGRLDLVLGDCGDQFEKELTKEEEQWREDAQREQAALFKEWTASFREYRTLARRPVPESDDAQAQREKELMVLRNELQRLTRIRDKYHHEEQALKPGTQTHGRVWLFLRGGSEDAPPRAARKTL